MSLQRRLFHISPLVMLLARRSIQTRFSLQAFIYFFLPRWCHVAANRASSQQVRRHTSSKKLKPDRRPGLPATNGRERQLFLQQLIPTQVQGSRFLFGFSAQSFLTHVTTHAFSFPPLIGTSELHKGRGKWTAISLLCSISTSIHDF